MWEIEAIGASSLDSVSVPRYLINRNRTKNQEAIKALLTVSMLMVFVGVPVFAFASVPVMQMAAPLVDSSAVTVLSAVQSGQFIVFYLMNGRFPEYDDWVGLFLTMGLSYAIADMLAVAFLAAGWISQATAFAILSAVLTPAGAIAIAGGIAAW